MEPLQNAVFFLEEDSAIPENAKPLMLETVLFCPILQWMVDKLQVAGVQRFLAVCGPRFEKEVRACFPSDADVLISEQHKDLMEFLKTPDEVIVFPRAALPWDAAGVGFVYAAAGYELQEVWKTKMTNAVTESRLVSGWLPIFSRQTIAELELPFRDQIVQKHIKNGVRILDPTSVYIDPRVQIGQGTEILPGSILCGESQIGEYCQIGPQAMIDTCQIAEQVKINASQVSSSVLGTGCDVGPYAHIRPDCKIGPNCHIGAFVQLKNATLGHDTKLSHLTYVGDSDVGSDVNFGCGVVTCNYDGAKKSRCVIGDSVFIGCNTNLVAPVSVGTGAYIAAGATVTEDVPADALAVARTRQENKADWAKKRRESKTKS